MKRLSIILFCLMVISSQSCTLENNSIVEDRITNVTAAELMPGAMSQVAYNQSNLCGRVAGGIMQYFTEGDFTLQTITPYRFSDSSFDNAWNTGYYQGSLANLNEIKKLAQEESNANIEAIANILLAHEFGILTNVFGDIPMSEALQGNDNLTPAYDTQEDVYKNIIALLEEATTQLENGTTESSLTEFDLIYQGNLDGWRKLAFGLKARYMLNLSKKDPSLYSEILGLVQTSSFTSSEEQANFTYSLNLPNPLFSFGIQRPGTLFSGIYFESVLSSDPRYNAQIFEENGNFQFFGHPNLTWTQEDSPIPIFSFTELKFIEAEVLHLMGFSIEETSEALSSAMQASFMETSGLNQNAINYINSRSNLELLSQNQERHERIMDEAYKAYYGYGHHQTWNNYRRTGYPALSSTSSFAWDGNPSNIIPRRFPYPTSEFELNFENLNEAITRQNGVLLDDDLWLFE